MITLKDRKFVESNNIKERFIRRTSCMWTKIEFHIMVINQTMNHSYFIIYYVAQNEYMKFSDRYIYIFMCVCRR